MDWDGFLMGISDFGLERLKEERQKKTQRELLELQQKYERESAEFKQKLKDKSDRRRSAGTRETADGRIQHFNPFGEDIGEAVEQSPWVQEARQMSREGHQSQMDYRRRQLDLQEQQLAERRRANEPAASGSEDDEVIPTDVARAMDLLQAAGFSPPKDGADSSTRYNWSQNMATALGVLDEGRRNNWGMPMLQRELVARLSTL